MSPSRYNAGEDELDSRIAELAAVAADNDRDRDLIREMIVTAVRLGRENVDRGDLKLVSAALKELRYAYSVFAPFRDIRKLSIFGSARTKLDDPHYAAAREIGRKITENGWMVITGAGPGIMQAGIEGAGSDHSFGVGIQLPFEPTPPEIIASDGKLINFRYFFTRKVTFMRESDAFVALPGGFGTMDEAFELLTLLQTGKTVLTPVVLLDAPGGNYWKHWLRFVEDELLHDGLISANDLNLVTITDSVDEAVTEICGFYANYHSMRFVGGRLIIRMREALSDDQLEQLNDEFSDIVVKGRIEVAAASSAEDDEPEALALPRLGLHFDKASHGRLRMLVNRINGRPLPGEPVAVATAAPLPDGGTSARRV